MNQPPYMEVARTVWDWEAGAVAPVRPIHRGAVLAQAAVAAAAGSFLYFYKGYRVLGLVVYGLGALMLVGGLWVPPLHRALDRSGKMLGRIVGTAVAWLLLVPFFYLCFTTARVALALRGRDPLQRRWDPAAATYWVDRKPIDPDAHFTRQY